MYSLHTTYFGLSGSDFIPEINMLTSKDYANINISNLLKYPLGWIITLTWIFLCIFIIITIECNYFICNNCKKTIEDNH